MIYNTRMCYVYTLNCFLFYVNKNHFILALYLNMKGCSSHLKKNEVRVQGLQSLNCINS